MGDRWFICCHDGWLLFHRSWTGICIFGLHLDAMPDGIRIDKSWVNRDPTQYTSTDINEDRHLVCSLISSHLLRRTSDGGSV